MFNFKFFSIDQYRNFQPWMMVTNLGIMTGVWTTFIFALLGVL